VPLHSTAGNVTLVVNRVSFLSVAACEAQCTSTRRHATVLAFRNV